MKKLLLAMAFLAALDASAAIRAVTPTAWNGRSDCWQMKRHHDKMQQVKQGGAKVVFIGDSITHLMETTGRTVWNRYFGAKAPYPALDLGFSGDHTQHILWRLENGEIDGFEAKVVVLMAGINNLFNTSPAEEPAFDTVLGVKACLDAIRSRQPKAKIVLCAIFPNGLDPDNPTRRRAAVVNRELAKFADGVHIFWCDLNQRFLRLDGSLPREIAPDGCHPSALGYEIWANAVIPYFNGYSASTYPAFIPDGLFKDEVTALRPCTRIQDGWWLDKMTRNRNQILDSDGTIDIVMFGDSITHYWEVGEGQDDSHDIEILRNKWSLMNCGYGGDRIENLLWRLENGELDGYRAKVVTLMIGTNNGGDPAEDIIRGVRRAIEIIKEKQPEAKIVLHAYLPCGKGHGGNHRAKLDSVTPVLKDMTKNDKRIVWLDMTKLFTDADGALVEKLFDFEFLHPSTEGYRIWREALEPVLEGILGK